MSEQLRRHTAELIRAQQDTRMRIYELQAQIEEIDERRVQIKRMYDEMNVRYRKAAGQ